MAGKYCVEFIVEIETSPWELVFLVGDLPELGSWQHDEAVQMLPSHGCKQWYTSLQLSASALVKYRYFVGQRLDAQRDDCTDETIIVIRWETFVKPRTIASAPAIKTTRRIDKFGLHNDIGNQGAEESVGWLTRQSEIRLSLHGNAIQFWKKKYGQKLSRVKVTPLDLRFREVYCYGTRNRKTAQWRKMSTPDGTDNLDDDDGDSRDRPNLPSHTTTLITCLNEVECTFQEQNAYGRLFRPDQDYIIFRTQTAAPEYLAFRIDFYTSNVESSSPVTTPGRMKPGSKMPSTPVTPGPPPPIPQDHDSFDKFGFCYVLPVNNLRETIGQRVIPVTSLTQLPIGQVAVDYVVVHPIRAQVLKPAPFSMHVSYANHWRKRDTLDVGHRGMGNSYHKTAAVRENTVASLRAAGRGGADYVEFDVQLTHDHVAVIYHDFHVCITVRRSTSTLDLTNVLSDPNKYELHDIPVKDLKLQQLRLLKLNHVSERTLNGQIKEHTVSGLSDERETQPFPTLRNVLQTLDTDLGFNIEVKFPMIDKTGVCECENYPEMNTYIDKIMEVVLNYCGTRRIIFSSFEPNTCVMLKLKQNRFPVLFLSQGQSKRYKPFESDLVNNSLLAIYSAKATGILGVAFHAEDLLRDANILTESRNHKLIAFVWGDDLDNDDNIKYFKQQKVDALIYDRISDKASGKSNIFVVERKEKENLMARSRPSSPVPSDGNSSTTEFGNLSIEKLSPDSDPNVDQVNGFNELTIQVPILGHPAPSTSNN